MKHFKLYALILAVILYTIALIYIGTRINKQTLDTLAIEEANTRVIEAENRNELDKEFYTGIINGLQEQLQASFDETNYQPLDITHQEDIPQADVYIPFVADYVPEIHTYLSGNETRKAKVIYPFRSEYFSADYTILYDYYSTSFEVTPKNLKYKIQKKLPFCVSASINSNSYGIGLSWDFLYRMRIGSNIYLTKEVEPVIGISVGFRF